MVHSLMSRKVAKLLHSRGAVYNAVTIRCSLARRMGTYVAKKILVVDDDVSIAELLTQSLSEEGYDVYKSVQSLRVYDAVREHQPDLILLDLMMPYLEGEDELQLMKLSPETARIPVIVVTAKAEADLRKEEANLRQLGVVHIVSKPFDLHSLVQLVKQTVG